MSSVLLSCFGVSEVSELENCVIFLLTLISFQNCKHSFYCGAYKKMMSLYVFPCNESQWSSKLLPTFFMIIFCVLQKY